jgi:glycosyltransferase involved in cell wall biosynthesis
MRVGGGTRMKIFEAMAMGRPVVSTTLGAEGLPVDHSETILTADEPESFARQVIRLFEDDALRQKLGRNGRRLVEEHCDWSNVARRFESICRQTVATASAH